jgi:hypothetical protein
MKNGIIAFAAWTLFLYGLFAFAQWDYNPLYWSDDARDGWAFSIGFSAVSALFAGTGIYLKSKSKI